ncbi:N-methylhydantoinase A/oxoprolinase/acetone carboxylase, beta subunit [Halogranum rubrum]|uniref:N-methylhydantoinase A/oxoprolinase/acetone carboxylase, beta subunit n=1 Tax=Halogranum rubrum TaxID=553466 RepID=A0A1I4H0R6_9EURY|nr:hydantoinase/oxoprolinase family protein [Halogranum rubrum]SFL34971.1 N-methylhydantoinase A/oxoprolinase/acetone carboxylase, beta subunit [Halogranum rubrum]
MTNIRVGIDVGGTFTDAVAIDSESLELLDQVKVPTTHDADDGVAAGIVDAASQILDEIDASPEDVVFLAHGTTQATNALLEGDVAKVGIVGMGKGLKGRRGRSETDVENIDLKNDQVIETTQAFVSLDDGVPEDEIHAAFETFRDEGVEAVVASQVFGVDDPRAEEQVCEMAREAGFAAIGANVVSKRYGLKVRTRTAVVNASILPRMMETSRSTAAGIEGMGVTAPLMIMRSDGGVMEIEEMQRRPIQTILSGPAAGVAGALMYENVTDGVFVEVGGTSSDISIIERGQPKWKSAEIGDHTTFLETLDIRTEGVAGGSMIRVEDGDVVASGPRSAHIADLPYAVYADPEDIVDPKLVRVHPKPDDPAYVAIETSDGTRYALTPSGASNLLGLVDDDWYAAGNPEAARRAFEPLAAELGTDVESAARAVLDVSIGTIQPVIEDIIDEYDLNADLLELVGGGGGSATLLPYLAENTDYDVRLATNHETISTIGVALAMVRDVVERNVMDPTEEEIERLRREAVDSVIGMGANQETVEAKVEYDASRNLLRAEAEGSTELQTRDLSQGAVSGDERIEAAAAALDADTTEIEASASTDGLHVYTAEATTERLFGLLSKKRTKLSIVDNAGVVKLKLEDAAVYEAQGENLERNVEQVLNRESVFSNSATKLPNIYIAQGNRLVDISGMSTREQVLSLVDIELEDVDDDERLVVVAEKP